MADLAKYVVALELQNKQYVQQLEATNRRLDRFHRQQEQLVSKVGRAFVKLGQTIVAAFSVQAMVRFTSESIKVADAIAKTSKAAGISAEELQKLRFAFEEIGGVSAAQTDAGLLRFNKTLGDAITGSKTAAEYFRQLGVAFRDTAGKAVSTEVALNETLRALAAIESDAARASRAAELFGRELGPKLAASLSGGIRALEETKQQITGLISNQNVKDAEALSDAFNRMATSIGTRLRNSVILVTADLAQMFGLIDRGVKGDLQRDLDAINDKIRNLEAADRAGSLGGNIKILEDAIQERERLLRRLKVEEGKTPFSERRRLLDERKNPTLEQPELEEITVTANRMEQLLSLEKVFQDQLKKERDAAMAANVERMQREVAAWDEYKQERMRQEAELQAYQDDVRMYTLYETGNALDALMQMSQGHSKKLFALSKAAAIANAILFAYEGISRTLKEYPYPFNIAMAAAHGVIAFQQVQRIRATSFGSGAASASVGLGGGASASVQTPAATNDASTTSGRQRVTEIHLHGDFYGFDAYVERKIIGAIRDAVDGRDVVIFGRNSRQADVLLGAT